MSLSVKRICLVVCAALGVFALGTGLAFAAGKPTSVAIANTHELNGYTVLELTAKVNPNGANTSTTIQFREAGSGEGWTEGIVHNLSGTTIRSYSEEFQVKPVQNYEARVKATNLFGTTESSIATVSTRVRTTGEKELTNLPFESEGGATFAWRWSGAQYDVICNEYSWGNIGNPAGKEDIYHYSMSGCVSFKNGKETPECPVSNFTFILGGPTLHVEGSNVISIPGGGCAPGGEYWPIAPKPFRVVDNGSEAEYDNNRSVTLTAIGTAFGFAENPAEITFESNWSTTGEYTGTPFKIADIGL